MWRALFLAAGVFLIILGLECLAVDTVSLKLRKDPPSPSSPFNTQANVGPRIVLTPPGWAPWSLMSSGAVVCLYSFTIPLRVKGKSRMNGRQ